MFRESDLAGRPEITWLRREIASRRNVDICIISGERLPVLSPRRLKAAITTAFGDLAERMTIVHYVRPQLDRMLSA